AGVDDHSRRSVLESGLVAVRRSTDHWEDDSHLRPRATGRGAGQPRRSWNRSLRPWGRSSTMTDGIRVAAIQPRSHTLELESRNVEGALAWMDRAAEVDADLVVFPEGYPGPTNPANDYDALNPVRERAAAHRQHVIAGAIA